MARHRVADVGDLHGEGSRVFAEIDGVEVAVFRIDGELYAVANYCVHQGGPVCEGELRGRMDVDEAWKWRYDPRERHVVCPWHGWKFDLTTGESVLDPRYALPTYDVEVEGDGVYVIR